MPHVSSSPPTSRTTTTPRLPNAARATTAASQARASTPNKQTQSNGTSSGQTRAATKARAAGVEKENEGRTGSTRQSTSRQSMSRANGRRASGASSILRDGLKDREPKSRKVEGLKDFVSTSSMTKCGRQFETCVSRSRHRCFHLDILHLPYYPLQNAECEHG